LKESHTGSTLCFLSSGAGENKSKISSLKGENVLWRFVMDSFFRPGNFTCPTYCLTRDRMDEDNIRARAFLENLFRDYAVFLDPDILQRATQDMPTVFCELYVACALHGSGVPLQQLQRTKQNKKSPDLFSVNPDVWIEAVMPKMGSGPDAMKLQELGVASGVPVDPFILRLRTAFGDKARAMTEYANAMIVRPDQAAVIAIGGCMLGSGIGECIPPRIVRALLGVGSPVLHLDLATLTTIDHTIEHRDEVIKKLGSPVKTDPFLDPAYAHISAVIYSASNWVTHSEKPGRDFTIIYNENANVPLPRGWMQAGEEYWREGNELRSARHSQT
jgi:hypothetical protein